MFKVTRKKYINRTVVGSHGPTLWRYSILGSMGMLGGWRLGPDRDEADSHCFG